MIIYKITNKINGKIYIGQTIHTLAHRKSRHLKCMQNGVDRHLYNAMRKYGVENFVFEEIDHTDNIEDLNYLESYYITKYDSVRKGYNMGYGGDNNVMFSNVVKTKHDTIMQSATVRDKISKSMKIYRQEHPFTDEHKRKLSESAMGNHNFGNPDTRSIECWCIDNGVTYHFPNYLTAGKWWYDTHKPFPYSACTYQRKIKQSIKFGFATYGRGNSKLIIENPRWFMKVGDANEVTD